MAVTVNIDSVTTADASPGEAPNKISNKATKDKVTFKFTPTATGSIRAWRARLDPLNRNIGKLLGSRGMVCGSGDRCGSPTARTLVLASATQVTLDDVYAQIAEPDGTYEVKVFAMSAEDGWSS